MVDGYGVKDWGKIPWILDSRGVAAHRAPPTVGGECMVEINCVACGQESLLKREPKYEGFTKVGERLTCFSCGHEYATEEEEPYKVRRAPKVFDDSDTPKTIKVFKQHEADRLCRYCKHYVVNPFLQRCALRGKLVEATDTCERFEKKVIKSPEA
jgi:hypothetical protein